jgi:hypothetical protein
MAQRYVFLKGYPWFNVILFGDFLGGFAQSSIAGWVGEELRRSAP